jgi:hypothetical protein
MMMMTTMTMKIMRKTMTMMKMMCLQIVGAQIEVMQALMYEVEHCPKPQDSGLLTAF